MGRRMRGTGEAGGPPPPGRSTTVSRRLYTGDLPAPDFIIRTSGERVSNFLLWQMAYAEPHFADVYRPELRLELLRALEEYQRRKRRFGA